MLLLAGSAGIWLYSSVLAGGGEVRVAGIGATAEIMRDDDGLTWQGPFQVTQQVRRETTNFAGTPGVGIQKRHPPHAGRVIFRCVRGLVDPSKSTRFTATTAATTGLGAIWSTIRRRPAAATRSR